MNLDDVTAHNASNYSFQYKIFNSTPQLPFIAYAESDCEAFKSHRFLS